MDGTSSSLLQTNGSNEAVSGRKTLGSNEGIPWFLGALGACGMFIIVHAAAEPLYMKIAGQLVAHLGELPGSSRASNILKQEREFLLYAVLVAVGFNVIWPCEWLWEPRLLWEPCGIPSGLGLYFSLQMAMYLHLMLMDCVDRLSPGGPDAMDAPSWLHHLICLVLASGTLLNGYVRAGSLTFFVHDPSSLALKASRVFYIAMWQRSAKMSFLLFAVLFFLLRIALFPILFYVYFIVDSNGRVPDLHRYCLGGLLFLIILMNVFFMFKIVCVLLNGASPQKPQGHAVAARGSSPGHKHNMNVREISREVELTQNWHSAD